MISDLAFCGYRNICIRSHYLRGDALTTLAGAGLHSPVAWSGILGLQRMQIYDHERLRRGGGQSLN